MFVGAVCFTFSGSNGSCWVVHTFFLGDLLLFLKKIFSPYTPYAKNKFTQRKPKKQGSGPEKKTQLTPKKNYASCAKKKALYTFSAQLSYTFLISLCLSKEQGGC